MTEVCDRAAQGGRTGVAVREAQGHSIPVLGNLFGTTRRVALAMAQKQARIPAGPAATSESYWRSSGNLSPPRDFATCSSAGIPIEDSDAHGAEGNFGRAMPAGGVGGKGSRPIAPADQTCWPEDGAVITWGLTVTRGPRKTRRDLASTDSS